MKYYYLLTLFLLSCTLTSCRSDSGQKTSPSKDGILTVHNAWARPAKQGMTSGAYLSIANGADQPDTLIDITTEAASMAEIHESYQQNGVSGMRPAGKLAIGPKSTLELMPGGYHIMLMQLDRELALGDTIELTLYFAEHDSLAIKVPIQREAQ